MSHSTKQSAFWAKLNDHEPKKHLRFIISDPDPKGFVFVVHASTYSGLHWQDSSCIILPGEYSSITKKSFIYYRYARAIKEKELLNLSMKGFIIVQKDKISDSLLRKVQNGAKLSEDLPIEFERFF